MSKLALFKDHVLNFLAGIGVFVVGGVIVVLVESYPEIFYCGLGLIAVYGIGAFVRFIAKNQ